ncbi:MAG TPA: T9SS type A sorting domain-containing protein, partial [Chitinophagales bacterium]|nr:T9SS type A sorting domain-containing protein [Chitinophagales bacterium]
KKLQSGEWTLGPCPANAKEIEFGSEGFTLNAQPNPFSESTTISFRLTAEERVSLVVYNVAGEEVAKLFEGIAEKDKLYSVEFKSDVNPDGMYFYRLVTEAGDVYIRKLIQTKQ